MPVRKNKAHSIPVKPIALSTADLNELFEKINTINDDAKTQERAFLASINTDEPAIVKRLAALTVQINIWKADGELVQIDLPNEIATQDLTGNIGSMRIDNKTVYRLAIGTDPFHALDVKLDFTPPPIFSLAGTSSFRTSNGSSIGVLGINGTWTDGTYQQLSTFMKERETARKLIHSHGVYDFLLWFIFFPAILYAFYHADQAISLNALPVSPGFQFAAYIWAIAVSLLCFHTFFNFLRWMFPYTELLRDKASPAQICRKCFWWIMGTIAAVLIGVVIQRVFFNS